MQRINHEILHITDPKFKLLLQTFVINHEALFIV
jgi:hypothetical protein